MKISCGNYTLKRKRRRKEMGVLINEMPHRPNVQLVNPSPILHIDKGEKQLEFTFQVIEDVTMNVTFPKDGGVRIRNDKSGMFEPDEVCKIQYEEIDPKTLKMTGNGTSVVLYSSWDKWEITVYDRNGEKKTSFWGGVGTYALSDFKIGINIDEIPSLYRVLFPINEGEEFYGFGERFNSFRQNKSKLLMWNTDILVLDGEYSDLCYDNEDKTQAYKNIPFVHSTNNYSLFFNSYLPITFDIGNFYEDRIKTEIFGTQFDLYIWTDSVDENIVHYHRLTGVPFVPPKWAFDYWIGGGWPLWNTPDSSYAYKNLTEILDTYESYGIKVHQAYLETDPTEEVLGEFRDRGIRTFMWTNSCLPPYGETTLNYDNYRIKRASNPNEIMKYEYIDFTSPDSKDVIRDKFRNPWDLGVCGEMVDFADSLPEDSICANGKNGTQMHNEYAYWYGRRMNEAFKERLGNEFVLFQRSGCAGSQHYTVAFGGDSYSSFLGLRRSVWQLLSASSSGISVWGSDIGGFKLRNWMVQEGPEFEELYMRWVQFGAFSPLMRDHSWHGKHHPWANGERGLKNFQYYYSLRLKLLDHIYSTAIKSGKIGGTMVDSMAIAYGMSPSLDTQYMFCDDFLVRPVMKLGERKVDVFIPEDCFYDLYSGDCYFAGKQEVEAPIDRIPVYIRSGAVVAYNDYLENIVPTMEKDQYEEAILLTMPVYKRESAFCSENGEWIFTCSPEQDGFRVSVNKKCPRRKVILLGTKNVEISADTEVMGVIYDEKHKRTIFNMKDQWKELYIKRA